MVLLQTDLSYFIINPVISSEICIPINTHPNYYTSYYVSKMCKFEPFASCSNHGLNLFDDR